MDDFFNFFQSTRLNIFTAGYLNVGQEWKQMVYDFRYVRIYYVRHGSARLSLTDKTLELKAGNMYFIPAFSILSGVCDNELGHYFIHIVPDLFTEHFFKFFLYMQEIALPQDIADYLFSIIVLSWNKTDSPYNQISVDSALRLILSYFLKGLDDMPAKMDLRKFTIILSYVDTHLSEKIYLQDLADLMFMDEVYFSNLFKKTFGISPQKYILQKRLDKSRLLLSDPTMTISEIAAHLNFFDASSFTNFFKTHTSTTPKAFRQRLFTPFDMKLKK